MAAALVWFRQDLRLADHPALLAAVARGGPIVPLFIWAPEEEAPWAPGAASRWWLHQSLQALDADLRHLGSRLILRTGPTLAALQAVAAEVGAEAVLWNRRYEPAGIARDRQVKAALTAAGLHAESHNGRLLHEPWTVANQQGRPYQVFTPFSRACLTLGEPAPPRPAPARLPAPERWPASLPLKALGLEPTIDWAGGLRQAWQPGAAGAEGQVRRFLAEALAGYATDRDRPAVVGTSRLSPHLHFGEISPGRVWHAVRERAGEAGAPFLRELLWREFAYHLLYHFPDTADHPLRPEFAAFPWREDPGALRAWRRGRTGYPIVDAGMRELWATGWMHNRVRMIAASFLVKHLLLPWQDGAQWFWDTLVDADLANNTLGWQWTAGCGADAAPYFRVFNPTAQARRFDPEGAYVRRWVPELARLPAPYLHAPEEAPPLALAAAGVELGRTYPRPLVEHAEGRRRALAAFDRIKGRAGK